MRKWSGMLAALGLLVLGGCSNSGSGSGSGVASRPLDLKRDANELVAEAVGRQAVLTSLAGDGVLAIADRNSSHRVNAEVVAADGQRLRISGGRMSVHAFDLMMYGDEVLFHDALKKRVYTGSVADLRYLSLPISPEEVVNQLLKPATELSYMRWQPDRGRPGDVAGTAAFVGTDGGHYFRAQLDKRSGLLMRVEIFDGPADGRAPYMIRSFGQYRLVEASRRARGQSVPALVSASVFPYNQRIEWPRESRKVEFTFKRVVPDAALAVDDFNVPFSDRAQRLPLRQAGFDPSGIDELSMR